MHPSTLGESGSVNTSFLHWHRHGSCTCFLRDSISSNCGAVFSWTCLLFRNLWYASANVVIVKYLSASDMCSTLLYVHFGALKTSTRLSRLDSLGRSTPVGEQLQYHGARTCQRTRIFSGPICAAEACEGAEGVGRREAVFRCAVQVIISRLLRR